MCNVATGQCTCRVGTGGRDCGVCRDGYYGLAAGNPLGCVACGCNAYGAVNGTCDTTSGQCTCVASNVGRTCSVCATGYFALPLAAAGVCAACHGECSAAGCLAAGNSVSACRGCRAVQDGGLCVGACPANKYADGAQICQLCDSQCAGGCFGELVVLDLVALFGLF